MAEGLVAYLAGDLQRDLDAGFRRTPGGSSDGGRWLARWALASALVGLILFLLGGYHGGFLRLNALATHAPDRIWQWLTMLGDERVVFALTLFFARRYPRVFWTLIAAAAVGVAVTHALKPLFSAIRPPGALDAGSFNLIGPGHRKASFPSGHTVTAAIFFGVWVYYVRSNWLRGALILLAVAAGLSRVAVGVHWPVDVAAGLVIGTTAALLGVELARRGEAWGTNRRLHLVFVFMATGMALSLILGNGDYAGAADMQRLLAVAGLAYGTLVYFVTPMVRLRKRESYR